MSGRASRAGAVLFALWGLLHVVGAVAMLGTLSGDGPAGLLALVATGLPSPSLSGVDGAAISAVLAQHSWDLLVIGATVFLVAITLNWRGRRSGFWVNAGLVSAVDAGLLGTMVASGVMRPTDALPGLALWIPAVLLSGWGLYRTRWVRAAPEVGPPAARPFPAP
ncbi:MAG: hypothetical protein R3E10_10110 [Gemmatimonadota bacterium]